MVFIINHVKWRKNKLFETDWEHSKRERKTKSEPSEHVRFIHILVSTHIACSVNDVHCQVICSTIEVFIKYKTGQSTRCTHQQLLILSSPSLQQFKYVSVLLWVCFFLFSTFVSIQSVLCLNLAKSI